LLGADPDAHLMVPTGSVGVGGGSPVTIEYHPANYRELNKRKRRTDPGYGPGEVLFHEMVHAMRRMLAKRTSDTVYEDLRMDDFEEFCSILAANIYRQERGFTSLRKDHWGMPGWRGICSTPAPTTRNTGRRSTNGSRPRAAFASSWPAAT
jgi:hypothetical protein